MCLFRKKIKPRIDSLTFVSLNNNNVYLENKLLLYCFLSYPLRRILCVE